MTNLLGNSQAFAQASPQVNAAASSAPATVASGGADLDHLPHGIRGLVAYPVMSIPYWVVALIGLILLALISWLGWRWWRRRHPIIHEEKQIHPLDRLRDEIHQLRPPLPFAGKLQEDYFYNLSLALRRFIEELLKIPATDLTLKELRDPLRQRLPLSRERIGDILAFFERADMIKFAQAPTTIEEAQRCYDDVKLWVAYLLPRDLDEAQNPTAVPKGAHSLEEASHRL